MKFRAPVCLYLGVVGLTIVGLNSGAQVGPLPIEGSISFYGTPTPNGSGSLATATAITSFTHVTVLAGQESGVFTNVPGGAAATWTPFTFSPPAAFVIPLWALTNNGVICSFDSSSMTLTSQGPTVLSIQGTGIAHITGFADTPGTWIFIVNRILSSYQFSAVINVSATNMPVLQSVTQTNGTISFSWNAMPGQPYQVEYSTDLTATNWSVLGTPITTMNSTATASDTIGTDGLPRFYRVWMLP